MQHHKVLTMTSGDVGMLTPLYNTSILVTKKPFSRIFLFGHFLVRLSGNECS